jgi:hypothetical protein
MSWIGGLGTAVGAELGAAVCAKATLAEIEQHASVAKDRIFIILILTGERERIT